MHELLFQDFSAPIPHSLEELSNQCKPNLEWCKAHIQERLSGFPYNPGNSYKLWPAYKHKASYDTFRKEQDKFSHTYMERIWPKIAGQVNDHHSESPDVLGEVLMNLGTLRNRGIRYDYGDLDDVVNLLGREPFTRQAYLPIWFPEDTGAIHGGRVPCTLGYLFIRRGDNLHVSYHIRSCDYLRHFRDDVYLACLKVNWILDQLGEIPSWKGVKPGVFSMKIDSLHIFKEDLPTLQYQINKYLRSI